MQLQRLDQCSHFEQCARRSQEHCHYLYATHVGPVGSFIISNISRRYIIHRLNRHFSDKLTLKFSPRLIKSGGGFDHRCAEGCILVGVIMLKSKFWSPYKHKYGVLRNSTSKLIKDRYGTGQEKQQHTNYYSHISTQILQEIVRAK